ncbi:MAG TPA: glycosyltransferase family 39 protein, partial [Anaerolineales bacterium]|nr:glycosyltransferase family 39 protein [Anaerolineales bacterium]
GCMLAGSWIAKRVETPRRGQILAAVFAGTIPLAIAQASGTATDIVLAFWCACAAAEAVYFVTDPRPGLRVWAYLGMSVGLAILTKPTAFAYVTPFLLWAGIVAWRRIGLRRMAAGALTAGLAVLLITSGYALRNTMTYGTLLGPQTLISQQANRLYTPAGVISNLVRNASLHLGTVGALNSRLTSGIQRLHAWLGLSPSDLRSTLAGEFVVIGPRNEDIIGNLVHTGLILLSFVVIWIRRKSIGKIVILLATCAAGAYLLFSVLYKWQLFGSRLQLPFFVLYAPVIGYLSVQAFSNRVAGWLGALLLVSALPWVLAMFSRPLVPLAPFTYPSSILAAPRTELYFANDPELAIRYPRVAESIAAERCTSIGLMLRGDEPEYLWWALLGAPKKPLEVEWIVAGNASAQYRNPNFQPCAIICTACPEEPVIRGVPLVTIDKGIRLYLQSAEEGRPEPHGPPSP